MFAVEFEGYNDGVPCQVWLGTSMDVGYQVLEANKKDNNKVRWRLVQILRDWSN